MTDTQDFGTLTDRLLRELADASELPVSDLDSIAVLIRAGETQVALEALCTQIYEYDLGVTDAQRARLVELGDELSVPAAHLLGDPWAPAPDSPGGC